MKCRSAMNESCMLVHIRRAGRGASSYRRPHKFRSSVPRLLFVLIFLMLFSVRIRAASGGLEMFPNQNYQSYTVESSFDLNSDKTSTALSCAGPCRRPPLLRPCRRSAPYFSSDHKIHFEIFRHRFDISSSRSFRRLRPLAIESLSNAKNGREIWQAGRLGSYQQKSLLSGPTLSSTKINFGARPTLFYDGSSRRRFRLLELAPSSNVKNDGKISRVKFDGSFLRQSRRSLVLASLLIENDFKMMSALFCDGLSQPMWDFP